ncbi:alpha/beta fold hydrolase [Chryseobacterium sp. PMSZPI]|uniref:alpha/beta fold hydrolase n=1 Tax=Chryseobacterium sp. PMSZPI TaxID=1033900 RepID=UPI0039A21FD9
MKETSNYLQRNVDGKPHEIYYTFYQPETGVVKATVLILHGMQEHSGRYADFAKFLVHQGFAVLTYDHLGHGKTAKNKGERGFFALNNPEKQMINTAKSMTAILEKNYPEVPHFIIGHSMGSFTTRCLLRKQSSRFRGAVIIGTGGYSQLIGPAKGLLAFLSSLSPQSHSEMINNLFGKICNSHFKDEEDDHGLNWLSVNKDNRKAFMQDELCGAPFTNNGFYTLFSLMETATARDWAKSISKDFPLMFVSGADDPVGDFSKGVQSTVDNLQTDGFQNVQMNLYQGMRHEILNEDIKEQVYDDIIKWLNSVIAHSSLPES